jgi:hypothetical protein
MSFPRSAAPSSARSLSGLARAALARLARAALAGLAGVALAGLARALPGLAWALALARLSGAQSAPTVSVAGSAAVSVFIAGSISVSTALTALAWSLAPLALPWLAGEILELGHAHDRRGLRRDGRGRRLYVGVCKECERSQSYHSNGKKAKGCGVYFLAKRSKELQSTSTAW